MIRKLQIGRDTGFIPARKIQRRIKRRNLGTLFFPWLPQKNMKKIFSILKRH
jgi:hypothetical protein